MAVDYLKKAAKTAASGEQNVRATVESVLAEIEAGGDDKAREFALKFDKWDGDIIVDPDTVKAGSEEVSQTLKDDIRFAHDNVRKFAEAQKATIQDCDFEVIPGLLAGQKQIPVSAAGC